MSATLRHVGCVRLQSFLRVCHFINSNVGLGTNFPHRTRPCTLLNQKDFTTARHDLQKSESNKTQNDENDFFGIDNLEENANALENKSLERDEIFRKYNFCNDRNSEVYEEIRDIGQPKIIVLPFGEVRIDGPKTKLKKEKSIKVTENEQANPSMKSEILNSEESSLPESSEEKIDRPKKKGKKQKSVIATENGQSNSSLESDILNKIKSSLSEFSEEGIDKPKKQKSIEATERSSSSLDSDILNKKESSLSESSDFIEKQYFGDLGENNISMTEHEIISNESSIKNKKEFSLSESSDFIEKQYFGDLGENNISMTEHEIISNESSIKNSESDAEIQGDFYKTDNSGKTDTLNFIDQQYFQSPEVDPTISNQLNFENETVGKILTSKGLLVNENEEIPKNVDVLKSEDVNFIDQQYFQESTILGSAGDKDNTAESKILEKLGNCSSSVDQNLKQESSLSYSSDVIENQNFDNSVQENNFSATSTSEHQHHLVSEKNVSEKSEEKKKGKKRDKKVKSVEEKTEIENPKKNRKTKDKKVEGVEEKTEMESPKKNRKTKDKKAKSVEENTEKENPKKNLKTSDKKVEGVEEKINTKNARKNTKTSHKKVEGVEEKTDAKNAKKNLKTSDKKVEGVEEKTDAENAKKNTKTSDKEVEGVEEKTGTENVRNNTKTSDKEVEGVEEKTGTENVRNNTKTSDKEVEAVEEKTGTENPKKNWKTTDKKVKRVEDKTDMENPNSAYAVAMKIRKEQSITEGKLQAPRVIDGKLVDSKGYRILKDQVQDLSKLTVEEVTEVLYESIIYDRDDIIAINKPYGLASQGGPNIRVSVADLLKPLAKKIDRDLETLHIVHRLDHETTGIMLLAKTPQAAALLKSAFKKREVDKVYWVIVRGVPNPTEGRIVIPMAEGSVDDKRRMVLRPDPADDEDIKLVTKKRSKDTKEAITNFKVIKSMYTASLVECRPETGVKHQIRVHLAWGLGTPIIGDHKYTYINRIAPQKLTPEIMHRLGIQQSKVRYIPMHLHAKSIMIPEFINGQNLSISCRLPPHFIENMKKLKLKP